MGLHQRGHPATYTEHLICQADLALAIPSLLFLLQAIYWSHLSRCEVRNVENISRPTILFVDDEPCMREVMVLILSEAGYETYTAIDGFDALAQLRNSTPDLIISDLHMPRMSGVEFLSVVRHRFPSIPVIAISGAFDANEVCSTGVMADAFYPKARCHPDELLRTVDELMRSSLSRPTNHHPCQPPRVQKARITRDTKGIPAVLLICTDCLRAFSWAPQRENGEEIDQAKCQYCTTPVNFVSDIRLPPSPGVLAICDAVSLPAI